MSSSSLTATAAEKLNRLAKRHRDETGKTLLESLDFIAQQAGYENWKQVTVLSSRHTPSLLPARHNWKSHWFDDSTTPRQHKFATVEELCERLSGVEPVLMRSHCSNSRRLCELDPFLTAKRSNVRIDIGDKYDLWNFLYLGNEPFMELKKWGVNRSMIGETYIHEQRLFSSYGNDDRSKSLNTYNPAYQAGLDNRSNQLNPNHPIHNPGVGHATYKGAQQSAYSEDDYDDDLQGHVDYFCGFDD